MHGNRMCDGTAAHEPHDSQCRLTRAAAAPPASACGTGVRGAAAITAIGMHELRHAPRLTLLLLGCGIVSLSADTTTIAEPNAL